MEHTRQGLIAAGLRAFAHEAHWFDCSVLHTVPTEVRDFGRDMLSRSMVKLPYPKTILWFGLEKTDTEAAGECAILLVEQETNGRPSVLQRCIWSAGHDQSAMSYPIYQFLDTGDIAVSESWNRVAGPDIRQDKTYKMAIEMMRWVGDFQGAMLSKECDAIRSGPSNRQVERAKRLGREAAIVFHTLKLSPWLQQKVDEARASGLRASPRLHWRRGHFRDLSDGQRQKLVAIPPCVVGAKERGVVIKDYALEAK